LLLELLLVAGDGCGEACSYLSTRNVREIRYNIAVAAASAADRKLEAVLSSGN